MIDGSNPSKKFSISFFLQSSLPAAKLAINAHGFRVIYCKLIFKSGTQFSILGLHIGFFRASLRVFLEGSIMVN